jgi:hypothetical protein
MGITLYTSYKHGTQLQCHNLNFKHCENLKCIGIWQTEHCWLPGVAAAGWCTGSPGCSSGVPRGAWWRVDWNGKDGFRWVSVVGRFCLCQLLAVMLFCVIIITWCYSPMWALASCDIRLHWSLSWAFLLHLNVVLCTEVNLG